MSIQERVQDAEFLWHHERHEGALLIALTAVAATAQLRYPNRSTVKDWDAFEKFLKTAYPFKLSVELRGELHSIEHVFYKWIRCELVHEGELPVGIQFIEDKELGSLSVRAGGEAECILKLSQGWFHQILNSVKYAPENN